MIFYNGIHDNSSTRGIRELLVVHIVLSVYEAGMDGCIFTALQSGPKEPCYKYLEVQDTW